MSSTTTVAIVGGGYGGMMAAKQLDDVADVVVIEPRDAFTHHIGSPRALIDPQWAEQIFLPYPGMLKRGRVIRARAEKVEENSVMLDTGQRIEADYIVLATGASYPYPAKFDDLRRDAVLAQLTTTNDALRQADSVLLLGGGAVGLEFAGEVAAAWPDKAVTLIEPGTNIVAGRYPDTFRSELRRQLRTIGVELRLRTRLVDDPPTLPGELGSFSAQTSAGDTITADIWFRCFGGAPRAEYLAGDLITARDNRGQLRVNEFLQLDGRETIFAIGDVTNVDEPKLAGSAFSQAESVAGNITAMSRRAQPMPYEPDERPVMVPLGPAGGAAWFPGAGPGSGLLGAEQVSEIKGKDMLVARIEAMLRGPFD